MNITPLVYTKVDKKNLQLIEQKKIHGGGDHKEVHFSCYEIYHIPLNVLPQLGE